MRIGRVGGRALACVLAAVTGGCADGKEVLSGGVSLGTGGQTTGPGSTDNVSTTTTTPATSVTTSTTTTEDTEDTSSVLTMEVACGNGALDPGEECDDGNVVNTDSCTNSCKLPICGDGFLQVLEECDDGNVDDTDACTNACGLAVCGDAIVQAGVEACDDGNQTDNDTCTNTCTAPGCGDGVVTPPEACDDANADNTDACTASCVNAACGDGIVHAGVEECDDANVTDGDGCQADCTIPQKFTAVGPQINFPEASLMGWSICFSGTYDLNSPAVTDAFAGCTKANLMLACRPVGSPTFALLAHAPREAVLADTGQENVPTVANGTGWYFNDSYSIGFAKEGDPISRNSCDTEAANPNLRLCWHSGGGSLNTGYRCGEVFLNGDGAWERVVLHAD